MTNTPPQLIVSAAVRGIIVDSEPQLAAVDDGGHIPFGVVDVEPLTYGFRLHHAELAGLGDAQVTADETLGDLDISAHASWGLGYVNVTLYRSGAKVPVSQMCVPYANVWVHLTGYPTE